jgi:hypothetical protein
MSRAKSRSPAATVERMLEEASWLLAHAEALADYGRAEEAAVELARAATCEEEVACLLEVGGQEREAAVHRVSAASCLEQLGQPTHAVTLLRAALSAPLPDDYRQRVHQQLTRCLARARQELENDATRRGQRSRAGS